MKDLPCKMGQLGGMIFSSPIFPVTLCVRNVVIHMMRDIASVKIPTYWVRDIFKQLMAGF